MRCCIVQGGKYTANRCHNEHLSSICGGDQYCAPPALCSHEAYRNTGYSCYRANRQHVSTLPQIKYDADGQSRTEMHTELAMSTDARKSVGVQTDGKVIICLHLHSCCMKMECLDPGPGIAIKDAIKANLEERLRVLEKENSRLSSCVLTYRASWINECREADALRVAAICAGADENDLCVSHRQAGFFSSSPIRNYG